MEMSAKAPRKSDIRDAVKVLVLTANDADEQRVLSRFYDSFRRGRMATLQVVPTDEPTAMDLMKL